MSIDALVIVLKRREVVMRVVLGWSLVEHRSYVF